MSRSIQRVAVRGARLTLWFAGAVLGGISCRDDDVAGPTEPGAPLDAGPALATTSTTALAFRQVSAGRFHSCGLPQMT